MRHASPTSISPPAPSQVFPTRGAGSGFQRRRPGVAPPRGTLEEVAGKTATAGVGVSVLLAWQFSPKVAADFKP